MGVKPLHGDTTGKPQAEEIQRQPDVVSLRPVAKQRGSERVEYSLGGQVVKVTFPADYAGDAIEVPVRLQHVPGYIEIVGPAEFGEGAVPMVVMPYAVRKSDWTSRRVYLACKIVHEGGDATPFPVAFRCRIY